MDTYLPFADYSKSADCLHSLDLRETRLTAYHTLRILERQQKGGQQRHYQLSSSDKGTIVRNANGRSIAAHGRINLVEQWEHYYESLIVYYNTICIVCELKKIPSDAYPSFSVRGLIFRNVFPSWLTEEYCEQQQTILLERNYSYYSRIFAKNSPKSPQKGGCNRLATV